MSSRTRKGLAAAGLLFRRSPWIFHNEEPQTRQDEIDEAEIMVKQLMTLDWTDGSSTYTTPGHRSF